MPPTSQAAGYSIENSQLESDRNFLLSWCRFLILVVVVVVLGKLVLVVVDGKLVLGIVYLGTVLPGKLAFGLVSPGIIPLGRVCPGTDIDIVFLAFACYPLSHCSLSHQSLGCSWCRCYRRYHCRPRGPRGRVGLVPNWVGTFRRALALTVRPILPFVSWHEGIRNVQPVIDPLIATVLAQLESVCRLLSC